MSLVSAFDGFVIQVQEAAFSAGPMKTLIDTLCSIQDSEQMQRFLEEVLTPAERKNLLLRWQLMQMLDAGVSQRQISKKLHISLCKITRGAKILKDPASVSRRYIEQLKAEAAQDDADEALDDKGHGETNADGV